MTVGPQREAPRPARGDGFSDAVTVAFGDAGAELYGVARLGLAEGGASGLAILFRGGEPVAVRAEGGVEVSAPSSWDEVSAAGLDRRRSSRCARGGCSSRATMPPSTSSSRRSGPLAELDPRARRARAGGMAGYEQPLRVTGSATVGDARLAIDGLGQRGHSWGAPDWERIALARTISAWLGDDLAVSLTAVRPAKASATTPTRRWPPRSSSAARTAKPGRSRWPTPACRRPTTARAASATRASSSGSSEDGWPRRAAGEIACGTSLDLGRLRLDCAFFRWRMEGREGVGRYDVLRRA